MDTQGGRASFGFSSTDPLRSATSFKVNEWPGRKRMKFVSWCYWRPPFWFPVEKKQRWTSQIFGILPITIIYMFSKVGGWFSVKNRCAHLELSKIERWSKSLKSIWWPGFLPFICSKQAAVTRCLERLEHQIPLPYCVETKQHRITSALIWMMSVVLMFGSWKRGDLMFW